MYKTRKRKLRYFDWIIKYSTIITIYLFNFRTQFLVVLRIFRMLQNLPIIKSATFTLCCFRFWAKICYFVKLNKTRVFLLFFILFAEEWKRKKIKNNVANIILKFSSVNWNWSFFLFVLFPFLIVLKKIMNFIYYIRYWTIWDQKRKKI